MRSAPRPSLVLALVLIPLASTACGGGEKDSLALPARTAATGPAKVEAAPEPGEKGHIGAPSTKQVPALIQATVKGNLEAVRALLDGGVDANQAREGGLTALHIATGENMLEIVRALLDKGADPNCKQEAGATPLHIAASTPDGLARCQLLVEHKADVNALDKKNRTPLIAAASNGQLDVVQYLLDKGAELDLASRDGATALHGAVLFGHKEVAALLLATGAKVDVADGQKNTPLHYAARKNSRELAELLVANGANILAKTVENATPFQVAVFLEHEELAKYLQELEVAAGGSASPPSIPLVKPDLETPKKGQAQKKGQKKAPKQGE